MHTSVRMTQFPVEFLNVIPINPLISKCQIKVCYVSDEPNRNKTVIDKATATAMANSLPGSPIVGYYNDQTNDFEEHSRDVEIKDGKINFIDITRPYGFVDLGAKVWFAKYLDDNTVEREYLCTEGYLWTGRYPECQRAIESPNGNNQSMELDKNFTSGNWVKNGNGKPEFFIVNEAIISALCVLGEKVEPCFEGAQITKPEFQFSFEDDFKQQLFSMMTEIKELLNKEDKKVFTRYSVKVGDSLWDALYSHVSENYSIEEVCDEGDQKFAVLKNDNGYFRMNFTINDDTFDFASDVIELNDYAPNEEPQFLASEVEEYVCKKKKSDNYKKEDKKKNEDKSEGEEDSGEDEDEDPDDSNKKKKKNNYSLDEIPEYVELNNKYSDLQTQFSNLETAKASLDAQIAELLEFKAGIERKQKEEMINSFYMLSDEDKNDVNTNIDKYSLDDIEAKLSIICVRNKVNFNLDNETNNAPTTFNLNDDDDDSATPEWVKAALKVAESMN